jgi:hypothetical protein
MNAKLVCEREPPDDKVIAKEHGDEPGIEKKTIVKE